MSDYEADRVVVELLAKVDGFDGKVVASTRTFEDSMGRIQRAANAGESAAGGSFAKTAASASTASQQMKRDFVDLGNFLQSEKSPFVVPVRQATPVSGAMKLVSVGAVALGGVLGGVAAQGAALLTEKLVDLIFKNRDTASQVAALVEKMREQAEQARLNEQANAIWEQSLDGLIEKTRKLREELGKQIQTEKERLEAAVADARTNRDNGMAEQIRLAQDLEKAQRRLADAENALRTARSAPGGSRENAGAIGLAQGKVDAAKKEVSRLTGELQRATDNAGSANVALHETEIILARMNAKNLADPIKAIEDRFAGMRKEAENSIKDIDKLTARLAELDKQEAAAKDNARSGKSSGLGGNQISAAEAAAIARKAGLQVNSSSRSYAEQKRLYNAWVAQGMPKDNPVARPGTSAHEGARGRWALDIQFGQGVTPELLRKVFADQGVSLSKVIKERGHFHVEGSTSQADGAAAAAQREAEAESNRVQAFQNERATLEDGVLDARQALLTAADEVANIELAAIELSRTRYADQVAHDVEIGKLHKDEAAELLKLNDERAALRKEAVQRRIDERNFRLREAELQRAQDIKAGGLDAQQDLLQSQENIAKTQRERAEIAQRLVDLQFAEERMMLQAAIDREARLKAEYERTKSAQILAELQQAEVDAALARQKLQTIDERQGNAQTGAARDNQSPLQSYFGDIQAQADDLNTAFEKIAAGGLQNFEDKLTDAIVNFQSLGDVGRAVLAGITADLVRLAIRLVLNATIGKLIGTTATTATAAQAAAAAAAWAPAAALASLATLGANAAPAAAALTATNALALGMAAVSGVGGAGAGFATGGRIFGPGSTTSDSIPIRASADEYMIKARSARQLGYDTLDYINATGELPMHFANGGRIRPSNARAFAPGARAGGFSQGDREFLAGELRRSIEAMPPIQLFPTTRPEAALREALATPGGRRAMFDFFSDEPAAISGTLNRR